MEIGVIGHGSTAGYILGQLLEKTAHNVLYYHAGGVPPKDTAAENCQNAAELFSRCAAVFVAMISASELLALLNGISDFVQKDQTILDFTQISPMLAHKTANRIRLLGARYLDCGVFSKTGTCAPPMLCFVGGSGETFLARQSLLRCITPDCRYMGPSGRGQAVRLFLRALSARIQEDVERSARLAQAFGIDKDYYFDSLSRFAEIAAPLAALGGQKPAFTREELERDLAVVAEMERRAGLREEE